MIKIFYSWQNDVAPKTNRYFIHLALRAAIKSLKHDLSFKMEFRLEQATVGEPGTPSVTETIFRRIKESQLFIGDLTYAAIVRKKNRECGIPNPNVLLELGLFAGEKGWEGIITVMNTAHSKPELLPFDLAQRRWPIGYTFADSKDKEERKTAFKHLSANLRTAILQTVENRVIFKGRDPKDVRAAGYLNAAFAQVHMSFSSYLKGDAKDQFLQAFNQGIEKPTNTDLAPREVLNLVEAYLGENSLLRPSNMRITDKPVPWTQAMMWSLKLLHGQLDKVLDRYSYQSEELVSIAHQLQDRCQLILDMLGMAENTFKDLYANGVPKVHIEWYVRFLIAICQARATVRSFGIP